MDKKTQYINGSTVLAPDKFEKSPIRKEDYDVLRKSQIERANRLKRRRNLRKRTVLKTIITVFAVGFLLMLNETRIYGKQQNITEINNEISRVNKENEDLRIQLVKLNSLQSVKQIADNELQMIIPEKDKAIYVDFSKNNFVEVPRDDKESLAEEFLAKFKSLLF